MNPSQQKSILVKKAVEKETTPVLNPPRELPLSPFVNQNYAIKFENRVKAALDAFYVEFLNEEKFSQPPPLTSEPACFHTEVNGALKFSGTYSNALQAFPSTEIKQELAVLSKARHEEWKAQQIEITRQQTAYSYRIQQIQKDMDDMDMNTDKFDLAIPKNFLLMMKLVAVPRFRQLKQGKDISDGKKLRWAEHEKVDE